MCAIEGHFPVQGNGHGDRYEIVGNIFFENRTEALFQREGKGTLARIIRELRERSVSSLVR